MAIDMNKDLTQERLKELLDYDEDTGVFVWRVRPANSVKVGDVAGYNQGYIQIRVDGIKYQAHRLVWLYVHGYFPEYFIDHMNGIKDDNRIVNLREVSNQCNAQSTKISSNNKSGYNGVSWNKIARKWKSQIRINSKDIHLGLYDCKLDAGLARITAEDWDNSWTCDEQCVSRSEIMKDLKDYIESRL